LTDTAAEGLRHDVSPVPAREPSGVEFLPWLWRPPRVDLRLMQD